ncbi:MAG: hypothetical protein AAB805_01290 [Patescibacteria group bacterium]
MGWIIKAFWILVLIFALAWLAWFFGRNADKENAPSAQKETETTQATSSLFGKSWFSSGFFGISTTMPPDNDASSFFKDSIFLYSASGAAESDPNKEFIEIRVSPWNKEIVVATGWSLKTSSGKIMKIGGASNIPKQGAINQETFIALEPGDRLAIISGRSPLGVSFRENICSGYLEQFQDFSPPLSRSCPTATSELWNRNLAGDSSCVSFAAGVDTCETPLTGFPGNLSSQCLLFAQNDLTYNGCVAIHKNDFSFFTDRWRFYAGENSETWNNGGGVIRLYDADGKIVDSLTY